MEQAAMEEGNLWTGDETTVAPLPPKPKAKRDVAAEAKVWIRLEESEGIPPTGQFFSVNGRSFMLRPGEPALVPEAIINILNDAVMAVPHVDPSTMQVLGYRSRMRFPYSVIKAPT